MQQNRESAETLRPAQETGAYADVSKSFRAKDAGILPINDSDKYKLQEIEKAIDCLLAN